MISGYFDPVRGPHPYVDVAVFIPALMAADAKWPIIPFLVDSGAAQTIVHPKDSIRRLGLSVPQLVNRGLWANVVENVGVGGQAVSFECPARYAFQDTAGQWRITDGNIRIAELTPGNQHLPSLLGWDLLRKFKTTILGNPQEISLEWL